ncbi:MAG: HEAT repeat domain-containing protein [Anaerolineae bacterium]|nr:HEAT repeat domain-containing protein [Anaerolineae bacterium]
MFIAKSLDELIADLNQPNPIIQLSAQKQLIRLGHTVIDTLLDTLYTGSDAQRAHAAIVLGKLRDRRALDALLELRHHDNLLIRIDCAKALGVIRGAHTAAALIDWLAVEENVLVQTAIVQVLAETRLPQIYIPLVKALTHTPSPSLKYLIIRILGDLGDTHAAEVIFPYVDSTDHHIRREAIRALEKLSPNTENKREL